MGTALICLDENSALDFLSGRLGAPALADTERHLGTCGACVELLARSAPFLPSRHGDEASAAAHRVSPAVATLAMHHGARRDVGTLGSRRSPRPPRTVEGDPSDHDGADAWPSGTVGDASGDRGLDAGLGGGDPPPTLAPGTLLKDTYTVLSLIGRGGMGEVYEVEHTRLAGHYALKLLPPAFAHEHVSVTRFRREADITSALRHPNIVQVIDFDHTPAGQPFLVMEYLDGGDLAQLMAARGPMPFERVLPIVAQIVSALSAVHRKGIVHRDLKPQNVLLVRDDDPAEDRVKLVDFGLSKRNETSLFGVGANISRERTLLGTPRYMAPEQASGRIDEIDATTDQFALGAMVYEMLTGVSAFNGEHIALLLYRIVSEEPVSMRSIVPDIPEHVEEAVRRAMSKQRSDRFATTSDFFEALSGMVSSQPGHPGSTAVTPLSDRGARAAAAAAAARARTPFPATPAAARPAGAGGPALVDSIDAMVIARTRRRRVTAFVIGVSAALLVGAAIPTLRTWRSSLPGARDEARPAPAAEPVGGPNGVATAPAPGSSRAAVVPPAAPPAVAPPAAEAAPARTGVIGEAAAPDGRSPDQAPAAADGDAGRSRVHGGPIARRARAPKRRSVEAEVGAVAPVDKARPPAAAEARPPVGRLIEDL